MRPLSTRTAGFTDSVIRRMTRISNKYGAINLSQGFPDFDPPKEITDRLVEIAPRGPHQYAITWGAQNFREALAKKQGDMRIDGGYDGCYDDRCESWRQSGHLFTVL